MKKIFILFFGLFLVLLCWFSFVKTYDHKISFQVDVPAGTMYDIVSNKIDWKKLGKEQNIINQKVFKSIQQEMRINDTPFKLQWVFENQKDTNAGVILHFLNQKNSLKERYLSLFKSSANLDSLIAISQAFKDKANSFASTFRIEINGIDTLPEMHYLYVSQHAKRAKKASNMIQNNAMLFVKNRDSLVTKTGNTFVYVENWNLETDSIHFRYAFPVKPQSEYPTDGVVQADKLPKQKALKATFYGNYSLSDQAWLALYHYAERNDIDIELTPIEIFYNNPMLGGDDRTWKAEIYMPIIP